MYKTSFKKLTSVVLAVLMLLSVFAVSASAADTNANSTGGRTILFTDNQSWGTVYMYAFVGDQPVGTSWPGDMMSASGDDGYGHAQFSATIPDGATGLVFSNGSGTQTVDCDISNPNIVGFYTDGTKDGAGHFNTIPWTNGGEDPTDPYTGETRPILFTDNQEWGTVYVYAFIGDQGVGPSWPGTKMEWSGDDGYGHNQYSAQIPAEATGLVFSNGSGTQTVDCELYDEIEGFYTTGETDGEGKFYTESWGEYVPTDPTDDTEYTEYTEPTQPTETQPVTTESTAPIVTEPASIQGPTDATASDEATSFYVSAKSNVNTVGSKVKVSQDTVQVTYTLKTDQKIDDGQFSVSFDSTKLSINPLYNTDSTMFPVINKDANKAFYNLDAATGVAVFNFSGTEGEFDFTGDGKVLINLVFQKKSVNTVGTATVYLNINELAAANCSPLIEDSAVKAGANVTVSQTVQGVAPTIPTETQAPTSAENNLTVNAKSNLTTAVETKVAKTANVKVTYNLTADQLIAYGDAMVTFDSSKLALESRFNTAETMFSTLDTQVSYRLNVSEGVMKFNFTNVGSDHKGTYDFRSGNVLITLMFTIRANAEGSADVNLNFDQLGSIDKAYVQDGAVIATDASVAADVSGEEATQSTVPATEPSIATGETTEPYTPPTVPTQSQQTTPTETQTQQTTPTDTQPTTPTETQAPTQTQPTGPQYQTSVVAVAEKSKITVKGSTKVYASVTNPVGATTFKSSNTKIATVSTLTSDICKVVGKKAGTVTITATNNGQSATVKIKVVKKSNPMTVKAKTVKASAKKKTVIKKTKAFTIKKAKGKVTFKKVKGDKKITINKKNGKITVKKGLKKGKTYKFKVKVTAAGNTEYKAKSKTVTVKIKITK